MVAGDWLRVDSVLCNELCHSCTLFLFNPMLWQRFLKCSTVSAMWQCPSACSFTPAGCCPCSLNHPVLFSKQNKAAAVISANFGVLKFFSVRYTGHFKVWSCTHSLSGRSSCIEDGVKHVLCATCLCRLCCFYFWLWHCAHGTGQWIQQGSKGCSNCRVRPGAAIQWEQWTTQITACSAVTSESHIK